MNQGWSFDHSEKRDHELCWRVPQAGRGNAFWIPLRINSAQEQIWADLLNSDVSVGEFRLQEHRTNWVLHVTVKYEVAEPNEPDDLTPVGFDIGESKLLTGCACQEGTPTHPYIYDGGRARHLRKEMHTTLTRLQERDAVQWRIDERFDHYQNALTDIVEKAFRQAVEYVRQFDSPVIVLEDLSNLREGLDYGKWMNRRLHNWAFARLTGRIEDKTRNAGIPVRFVNPAYTSQTCHACDHIGSRSSQAAFRCTDDECWVSEYQADINGVARISFWLAARFPRNLATTANIAGRLNSWGESLPWKSAGDDSPQDGSACDSTIGHREQSPDSGQTTLTAFQS